MPRKKSSSDSDISDEDNETFGYDLFRGGNSDHTSEDDATSAADNNEMERRQDKKFQAKIFRQFKKGLTCEEVFNVLTGGFNVRR